MDHIVTARLLSSKLTFVTKFILPMVWISAMGALTVLMWTDRLHDKSGKMIPEFTKWAFLGIFIIGSTTIWWTSSRLKKVSLSNQGLLISNFRAEIEVPLSNVERVTVSRWNKGRPVTIHFRRTTEFGPRVTFLPPARVGWQPTPPIVRELQELADKNAIYRVPD